MSGPDLSEFVRYANRTRRTACRVAFVLEQLDKPEAEQLSAALETDKGMIPATAIMEWARRREQELSISSVGNHRNKRCSCYAPE